MTRKRKNGSRGGSPTTYTKPVKLSKASTQQDSTFSTMKGPQRSTPPSPTPSEQESLSGESYLSSSSRSTSPSTSRTPTPQTVQRERVPPIIATTAKKINPQDITPQATEAPTTTTTHSKQITYAQALSPTKSYPGPVQPLNKINSNLIDILNHAIHQISTASNFKDTILRTTTLSSHQTPPDQRHHQPDVLDIAILKNINLQYQLCNFTDELSSDHSPVILTLHGKPLADPPKPTRTMTNWPKFAVQLHVAISSPNPSINSISELDQEIRDFTTMAQEVLSKNTSELNKQPNQILLPDSIKRELTKKRRLRRAWQNTRNPEAKHRFNNQTSKVKRLLQHHRESAWSSFLAELKPGDTKIFKINKSLINRTPPNRPLNSHLGPVFDSPGKSELFATNLATQFNCPDGNQATNQLVANSMRTLTTSIKSPIQSVSPGEDNHAAPCSQPNVFSRIQKVRKADKGLNMSNLIGTNLGPNPDNEIDIIEYFKTIQMINLI
ncbi:hypothetical protein ACI65C_010791 [Semiaphis heraclei]